MRSKLEHFSFPGWTFPVVLFAAAMLAYGLLAGELGFFWDDWPFAWISHTYGASGFTRYFSTNRPVWGLFYKASTELIGREPIAWHLMAACTRFLCTLSMWWALRCLFQKPSPILDWAALLYLVYPGMTQQFVAIMHTNYDLVQMVFWLSFALMGKALMAEASRYWLLLISAVLAALTLFSTEYFFGLELLRPIFLWYVFSGMLPKVRIKQLLRYWWPYALVITFYTYWRVFVFSFQTYAPATLINLAAAPLAAIWTLIITMVRDVFNTGVLAWLQPLWGVLIDWSSNIGLFNAALILLTAVGLLAYMLFYLPREDQANGSARPQQMLLIGLVSLFLAGIPFWVTALPVRLSYPNDRFTMPFMFGSSLLLSAGLYHLVKRRTLRTAILSLLVAFAIGYQFQAGASFRQEWKYQQAFFQQLLWRAPHIEAGTTLVSLELPLRYVSDDSLTAPLNWIYAPENTSQEMSYHLGYLNVRVGRSIPDLVPDQPIYDDYLAASFHGSTSQLLAFSYQPPACLRIYDPVYDRFFPLLEPEMRSAVALSDPARLVHSWPQAEPPMHIFNNHPDTEVWCYYFQKADLARQSGDWEEVAALGDIAFMLDDSPNHATERLPFIEAYARSGRWSRALELSRETYQINKYSQIMLCELWSRVEKHVQLDAEGLAALLEIQTELACP